MPPRDRTKRRALPTQARAHASVEAILTAAEQLLRERGFAATTTNDVAARAGVNVALVYRYFAGKEALVGALIERFAVRTYEAARDVLRAAAHEPMPVALRSLLTVFVDTPGLQAELHRELVEQVDLSKRRAVVHDARDRIEGLFVDFLHARRAELRPSVDPAALLFVLKHAIDAGAHAVAFYRPDTMSKERALNALVELVERALLPASAHGPSSHQITSRAEAHEGGRRDEGGGRPRMERPG